MFTVPAFVKMGLISCPIGAYLGMLMDCKLTRTATPRYINEGPIRLVFLRLAASILSMTPLLIPYLFVKSTYSVYTQYLARTSLPFFVACFLLFGLAKALFIRLGIQNP